MLEIKARWTFKLC